MEKYRLEIRNGKKVLTKPRYDSSNGNTKGGSKTDKECFRCGRVGHIRADCRSKTHVSGGSPKSAPRGKGVGNCEEEKTRNHRKNVPMGKIELSDHGETTEDDVVVDESS